MATRQVRHSRKKSKKSRLQKSVFILLGILILIAILIFAIFIQVLFKPNVYTGHKESVSIYIPTGSDFNSVKDTLYSRGIIIRRKSFEWLAKQKEYPTLVKPGHYIIKKGMSNDELINLLRSGNQTPVKLTFNVSRNINEVAGIISRQIEADSAEIIKLTKDENFLSGLRLSPADAYTLFIPNTYEFWWTTDANGFLERMKKESDSFWNEKKQEKLARTGLTIPEVFILASIVEKETVKQDEKPAIAGVYINRLRKGWKLQADPTLVFASGDNGLRRVLNRHKNIDSPYNTYKYKGLPPGPICVPSIQSLEAVLSYQQHDFMYFCAKSDFSGYHAFSRTLQEHNRYARQYQQMLDRRSGE